VDIIAQLKADHRNLALVLKCLERQLDAMEQDGDANYPLMQSVMHYIVLFPDQVHHPNEEILFAELRRVHPDAAQAVDTLSDEHDQLAELSQELEQIIDAVANEHIVSKAKLIDTGRRFLKVQFDHMRYEENELFPLFVDVFSRTETPLPDLSLCQDDDPLFSKTPVENLQLLHQSIMASNAERA
jgi:hemerythrin-like domain-containing protein